VNLEQEDIEVSDEIVLAALEAFTSIKNFPN